ncbi:MAG TPA: DUF642 domain-containing protein, partial [Planctomycetaceae bacterium]
MTRRLLTLFAAVLLVAQATVLAVPVAASSVVVNASVQSTAWTATGSGIAPETHSVPHDGTGGLAELDYSYNLGVAGGVPTQTWTLHATAQADGTQTMRYVFSGLHAWFNVKAGLRSYVTHGATTTYATLVNAGPENCCTTPSGGFSYTGTTDVVVQSGDVYGFEVTGSNGDLNSFLQGTLKVGLDVVANGGFEDPVIAPDAVPNDNQLFNAPSTALTGWSVDAGSVQTVPSFYWPAVEGNQSLDLDGEAPPGPGTLSQTVTTIPGQAYRIDFQYSSNRDGPNDPSMTVQVDGNPVGSFTHPALNHPASAPTLEQMAWTAGSATFTATGATTFLEFVSNDPSNDPYGIALDDVSAYPDLAAPPPPPPATDFGFGAPTPSPLAVNPGASPTVTIPTTASGTGTIALSASVVPFGQGLSVSLDAASAPAGSAFALHVDASVGATPGVYTATVTGTLASKVHSVTIPITVGAITGIPQLYEAVPGIQGSGANASITDVPGDANRLFLAGLFKGTPSSAFTVTFRTGSSCTNGVLGAGATSLGTQPITTDAQGLSAFAGPISFDTGTLSTYVAAQITSPTTGLVGTCIVASPPN